MKSSLRLFVAILTLLLAYGIHAQDRLSIEVVPVYILPQGAFSAQTRDQEHVEAMMPVPADADLAVRAVHEAMSILRVDGQQYDVFRSTDRARILECTLATPGIPSTCGSLRAGNVLSPINEFGMLELWLSLGFETSQNEPSKRDPGTVLALILVKHPEFPWDGGIGGRTEVRRPIDTPVREMHWSTTTCSFWAHLHVTTIAHELGHCFGLLHNGPEDENFDGTDNTLDLMTTNGAFYHRKNLKLSNIARVIVHFRDLPEPLEASRAVTTTVH